MKSIFILLALFVMSQSGYCQDNSTKIDLKKSTKTASVSSTTPHRNLNSPVVYTFTGNGYWSNVNNWDTNGIPPNDITPGSEIHINSQTSGAQCILDVPYEIPNTTSTIKLTVYTGSKLVVPDLIVR